MVRYYFVEYLNFHILLILSFKVGLGWEFSMVVKETVCLGFVGLDM